MWPGQQQPGGGQNPQEPNPYQQPGYQQPNPYQQPGYQQPNPYQQPAGQGQGQWSPPGVPGGPPPGDPGKKKRANTVIAIAVSLAVVAGAVVAGVVLLGGDEEPDASAKGGDTPSATATPSQETSDEPEEADDEEEGARRDPDSPRGSGEDEPDPEPVVPGWQVVINPKHHSAFDVPEDWELGSKTTIIGWGEKEQEDGALFPVPEVAMSAPAYYKDGWCKDSDGGTYSRSAVGTKGAQGAKNTSEAALSAAQNFVYYRHGEDRDKLDWTESKPFKSEHGIEGHIATATVSGVKKGNKCEADGKAVAVSWLDASRELRLWILITDTGVEDEVPEETIDKMTASLRPYGEQE
ncbi:hypothetical protein [Streptomyces sp. GSL17-111]|uniref:hypothetical protein n=1 Tax=Streptomyces sp. GSL17-111 TaxID=3121596 RepID=UPI0030F3CD84